MSLLIATGNASKAREFRTMLGGLHLQLLDLSQLPAVAAPEETGTTFCENASLKATFYARQFDCLALADDSGIEIDALDKKPGVYSARWAQMHDAGAGDEANNALLLKQLANISDDQRAGRFVCCLALSDAGGKILHKAQRTMEGQVLHETRGSYGFGYDGLFLADGQSLSNGELPPEQKQRISHRGKAMQMMIDQMRRAGLLRD